MALAGASVAVRAGEIVAVMGPSGSGKSTLLHCLGGIVPPDSGSVAYDGRDLTAMSDVDKSALRRSEFGFIFQFGQLVPELTCIENVAAAEAGRRTPSGGRAPGAFLARAA